MPARDTDTPMLLMHVGTQSHVCAHVRVVYPAGLTVCLFFLLDVVKIDWSVSVARLPMLGIVVALCCATHLVPRRSDQLVCLQPPGQVVSK